MKTTSQIAHKICLLLAIGIAGALLAGCDNRLEQSQVDARNKNPAIETIGVFDGCEVKYVSRAYADNSFYIARCGTTVTTTRKDTERLAKGRVQLHNRTEITETAPDVPANDAPVVKADPLAGITDEQRAAIAEVVRGTTAAKPDSFSGLTGKQRAAIAEIVRGTNK